MIMTIPSDAPTRVLILEDEPELALALEDALEKQGFEVVGPAHSCEAALELLWTGGADVAILDILIGEGTCEVVANELRLSGIPWAFASDFEAHELHDRFPDRPLIKKRSQSDAIAGVIRALLTTPSEGPGDDGPPEERIR